MQQISPTIRQHLYCERGSRIFSKTGSYFSCTTSTEASICHSLQRTSCKKKYEKLFRSHIATHVWTSACSIYLVWHPISQSKQYSNSLAPTKWSIYSWIRPCFLYFWETYVIDLEPQGFNESSDRAEKLWYHACVPVKMKHIFEIVQKKYVHNYDSNR